MGVFMTEEPRMAHEFNVQDMTCGHCVARVTKALKEADPAAEVTIDLPARKVSVDGTGERDEYAEAIRAAGYTPA
jgi:copper chaperone CopZ